MIVPVDIGRKLNLYKTFRRRPRCLLNVLCTFNLHPVSTGDLFCSLHYFQIAIDLVITFFSYSVQQHSERHWSAPNFYKALIKIMQEIMLHLFQIRVFFFFRYLNLGIVVIPKVFCFHCGKSFNYFDISTFMENAEMNTLI